MRGDLGLSRKSARAKDYQKHGSVKGMARGGPLMLLRAPIGAEVQTLVDPALSDWLPHVPRRNRTLGRSGLRRRRIGRSVLKQLATIVKVAITIRSTNG